MKVGLAIYNILKNDGAISSLVGTRIFPNVAPQTTSFPFIIYQVTGVEPNDTKEAVSTLDVNSVMVSCYSETYNEASQIANRIRIALDRITASTYEGIQIQSSQFQSYNDLFDDDSGNEGIYRKALDFEVRQIIPPFSNQYSLLFDGVDDYLTCGDVSTFSFGDGSTDNAFSIGCWIYGTDLTAAGFVGKDSLSLREYQLLTGTGDRIRFRLYDNSTVGYIQSELNVASSQNTWLFVVATYDGSSNQTGLNIYVNAATPAQTKAVSGTYTAMEDTTAPLTVGASLAASNYMTGNIDEVSLWSKELSASEVTTLYNSGTPTDISSESNLIGWWRNGEGAVYPTIPDDSINFNEGTMTNMTSGDIVTTTP